MDRIRRASSALGSGPAPLTEKQPVMLRGRRLQPLLELSGDRWGACTPPTW